MSVPAFAWAMEQGARLGLSPAERLVLIYLADKANGVRVCWPGRETIAHYTGLALRTVRSVVGALARRGLIMVEDSPGRVSRYHILRCETPANEDGVTETDDKVIHSPGKSSQGAPANGARVDPSEGGTSRPGPWDNTVTTPANGATEPVLTKQEPKKEQSQNLDSGEGSKPDTPKPWNIFRRPGDPDASLTSDGQPRATAEGVHRAAMAAIRAITHREYAPGRAPALTRNEQIDIATRSPPPLNAPLPAIHPAVLPAVLAARRELAERAAQRQAAYA